MEDKKKIYIVQGSAREYSDHIAWCHKAYFSEEKAVESAKELNSKLLELGIHRNSGTLAFQGYDDFKYEYEVRDRHAEEMQKVDPDFETDYTGSVYTVIPCELADEDKI